MRSDPRLSWDAIWSLDEALVQDVAGKPEQDLGKTVHGHQDHEHHPVSSMIRIFSLMPLVIAVVMPNAS